MPGNDLVMGPGTPCERCAGVYGRHSLTCPVPKKRADVQREADSKRGEELLRAIEKKDAVSIGRLLRGAQ